MNNKMVRKPTGAQKRVSDASVLAFLALYNRSHGYPPSIREIGAGVGIRSSAAMSYRLKLLVKQGLLVKHQKGIPRSYTIPPNPNPQHA